MSCRTCSIFVHDLIPTSCRAILHDPEEYHNPEMFDPERFLVCNTSVADNGMPTRTFEPNPSVRDPRTAAFGFGRRICPGIHLADASLFAMISTILATVDVVRAKKRRSGTNLRGEEEEIVPQVEVASGLLNRPLPFEYAVRPRSGCVRQLLDASLQD
jgi:cytochrome P450